MISSSINLRCCKLALKAIDKGGFYGGVRDITGDFTQNNLDQ